MVDAAPRRAPGCVRAANVALGWVVVFVGFHVYWYLGGSFASPGTLPGEPRSLLGWTFNVLVYGAFALGLLVPLAISRGWVGGRLSRPVAVLVWLGALLLVLRGAAGIVDDLARAAGVRTGITGLSTEQSTGLAHLTWSGWAIDGYFLIGGMIFTWLAVRQSRQPDRR
jgi:hypothetical protein